MHKDFDEWNKRKKLVNNAIHHSDFFYHEREVWWCALGINIGSEEDGKGLSYLRPVLVVRKFNKDIFYGLPITSNKKDNKFHLIINSGDIQGSIILSQMRLIDAKRLSHLFGKITGKELSEVKKKLKALLP